MKREIRIASPCSADWDRMAGDERVRHCDECNLDVYNFSAMSGAEVERIVAEREGRLCGRFYQRADGTMLTQNCRVGFRAAVRRVSRVAGAALTAMMSAAPAMAGSILPMSNPSLLQIRTAQIGLALEVVDPKGAVVGKAKVSILNERTGVKAELVTDASGQLRVNDLPAGKYKITVTYPGFKARTKSHISVPSSIEFRLQPETLNTVVVGEVVLPQTNPFQRVLFRVRRIL